MASILKRKKIEIKTQASFFGAKFEDDNDEEVEEIELTDRQTQAIQKAVEEQAKMKGLILRG